MEDLADEVPEGQTVVAGVGAGLVNGRRALDGANHERPIQHAVGVIDHLADVVEARLVGEYVAKCDRPLAGLRKLRPVIVSPAKQANGVERYFDRLPSFNRLGDRFGHY